MARRAIAFGLYQRAALALQHRASVEGPLCAAAKVRGAMFVSHHRPYDHLAEPRQGSSPARVVPRGPSQRAISEPCMQGALARCLRGSATWVPHPAHTVPCRAVPADAAATPSGREGLWLPGGPQPLLVSNAFDRERAQHYAKGPQRLGQGAHGNAVFVVRRVSLSADPADERLSYAALRDMVVHTESPLGAHVLPMAGFGVVANVAGAGAPGRSAAAHGHAAAMAADVTEAFYLTPYLPARSLQDFLDEQHVLRSPMGKGPPTCATPLKSTSHAAVAMLVLFDMAKALASLQDAGVLHRNIQPKHVLWDGQKWLLGDFERAFRLAPHERRGKSLLATKDAWVPPLYGAERGQQGLFVAPEHFAEALSLTPTPYAYDRWCLGATVLEALQFQAPWPTLTMRLASAAWPMRRPADADIADEFANDRLLRAQGKSGLLPTWLNGRRDRVYAQIDAHDAFWQEADARPDADQTHYVYEQVMAFSPQDRATPMQMQHVATCALEALRHDKPACYAAATGELERRSIYPERSGEPSAQAVNEQVRWLRWHVDGWAWAQRPKAATPQRLSDAAWMPSFDATHTHFDFRAIGRRPLSKGSDSSSRRRHHRRVNSATSDAPSTSSASDKSSVSDLMSGSGAMGAALWGAARRP